MADAEKVAPALTREDTLLLREIERRRHFRDDGYGFLSDDEAVQLLALAARLEALLPPEVSDGR